MVCRISDDCDLLKLSDPLDAPTLDEEPNALEEDLIAILKVLPLVTSVGTAHLFLAELGPEVVRCVCY